MAPCCLALAVSACAGVPPHSLSALPAPPAPPGALAVRFPSLDADLTQGAPTLIDAIVMAPAGAGPFPAVVALHGCAGPRDRHGAQQARDRDWALRLRDQGYLVLLPDSFGPRGVRETCTRHDHPVRPGHERARDAYGALAYLQSRSDVRAERVALLGWSNGGITTLWALARGAHARPPGLSHDFRVAIAFYPGCARLLERDYGVVAPLHILIGASDDWTPAAPCRVLAERARAAGEPVELVVYPGAFHDFDAPDMSVHVRRGVASTRSGTATLGTNPTARSDAIARVTAILAGALR